MARTGRRSTGDSKAQVKMPAVKQTTPKPTGGPRAVAKPAQHPNAANMVTKGSRKGGW
jgi:hypothetical protein